jgi:hypothetical protein
MLRRRKSVIKLRIDVDYPYPSRLKSFFFTALTFTVERDYLKNSKILARMLNESKEEIKAYWFFTPKTIPDKGLLDVLNPEKHEVALHVANHPYDEMERLEKATGRQIEYYTIHGTARLLGRILWKRWKTKTVEIAEESIAKGTVLQVHPEWLFQRGTINHRGPYYEALRRILKVDEELGALIGRKKLFFKIARSTREYERDVFPTEKVVEKLSERDIDIFTFIERRWHHTIPNPPKSWIKADDNIAILQVPSYDEWWKNIGKKTRNMVRKAKKSGITTKVSEADAKLAEGMWKIYNETPIRQGRAFPHYGVQLKTVKRRVSSAKNSTFIGSYVGNELAGFIQLVHGDNITITSQILSLQKHWDKAVNNALLAKAIEVCANQQVKWLMYGRMGNHPSLDRFKQSNGFTRFSLTRYYIPLTKKGKIATKLGLHKEVKDALPQRIKYLLIPIYNWISRTRLEINKD